jgi:nuclear transport factor 2 (NTF2) superfamily protein
LTVASQSILNAENPWNPEPAVPLRIPGQVGDFLVNPITLIRDARVVGFIPNNSAASENNSDAVLKLARAITLQRGMVADSDQWWRSHGNENWEFDEQGYMARRYASINDQPILETERKLR